jgi:hypothetical protein
MPGLARLRGRLGSTAPPDGPLIASSFVYQLL